MKTTIGRRGIALFMAVLVFVSCLPLLTSCSAGGGKSGGEQKKEGGAADTSRFLVAVEDEPDTVDFQCTTIYYTVATNVFNRLVEMESDSGGNVAVKPSLAESWEVSDGGRRYTFHLREGVKFSNGSPLTSSDVLYTFTRLLTHPESCNQDIIAMVEGASRLESGKADRLDGFEILGDLDFAITLEQPFEAFLACLSMPGASILDEETTEAAGGSFGKDPAYTIGTGSFILRDWEAGKGMILVANKNCFEGEPHCDGLDLRFIKDSEEVRRMFESGELDILDLDEMSNSEEFFIHGESYKDRIYETLRIGTTYIALNESIAPLDDVRVRKALQYALDRSMLLDAVYGGRGYVENGIFPHGLYGYNPDLPEIPYDTDGAKKLLAEAGYPDGFDMEISVKSSSNQWEMALMKQVSSMWEKIGVRAPIVVLEENEFMKLRKSGSLTCYTAMWTADFNDPDNFIYTFFGNSKNTSFRSLCYPDEEVMARVRNARTIADPEARVKEYRELEEKIIQEDAAWIPLFSRLRTYVTSERVEGIQSSWNGSVKNKYREITIRE